MEKLVSVVLGSYNRKKFLKLTIDSIRRELNDFALKGEIIVVDGGSGDGSAEWLIKQKDIISIIQNNHGTWNGAPVEKKNWGGFMNLGFKCAKGKYICMVSDDCLLVPGAVKNGIELIEEYSLKGEKIGGAAFYWRDVPGEAKYWVGGLFDKTYLINHGIFTSAALSEAGYIDENSFRFYFADADLCLRLNELGYNILLSEKSFIEHYSHANIKQRKNNAQSTETDQRAYLDRWEQKHMRVNPFYSKEKGLVYFTDPQETYKEFRKAQLVNYHHLYANIKKRIKKIIRKHE